MKNILALVTVIVISLAASVPSQARLENSPANLNKFIGVYKINHCAGPTVWALSDLDSVSVEIASRGLSQVLMKHAGSADTSNLKFDPSQAQINDNGHRFFGTKRRYNFKVDSTRFEVKYTVCGINGLFSSPNDTKCIKSFEQGVTIRSSRHHANRFEFRAFQIDNENHEQKFDVKCDMVKTNATELAYSQAPSQAPAQE